MIIKLSGGVRDGDVLEVSDSLNEVSVALLSLGNGYDRAEKITSNTIKRHSWDDEALNTTYLTYRRSEMEADDGSVIFVPQT